MDSDGVLLGLSESLLARLMGKRKEKSLRDIARSLVEPKVVHLRGGPARDELTPAQETMKREWSARHEKQPVVVTDEMVKKALDAWWNSHGRAEESMRKALVSALS